jgi:hypothetical protein
MKQFSINPMLNDEIEKKNYLQNKRPNNMI